MIPYVQDGWLRFPGSFPEMALVEVQVNEDQDWTAAFHEDGEALIRWSTPTPPATWWVRVDGRILHSHTTTTVRPVR